MSLIICYNTEKVKKYQKANQIISEPELNQLLSIIIEEKLETVEDYKEIKKRLESERKKLIKRISEQTKYPGNISRILNDSEEEISKSKLKIFMINKYPKIYNDLMKNIKIIEDDKNILNFYYINEKFGSLETGR